MGSFFEMNDVNNDGVVDVRDVAQLVSDIVYKRTSDPKYSQSEADDTYDEGYTAGVVDVLSEKIVFVNTDFEVKVGENTEHTSTVSDPEFTSSLGVTYINIEHAFNNLDVSGNYGYTYKDKAYGIYINTWNVSLVTSMTGFTLFGFFQYNFMKQPAFNHSIGNWNVSSVTDMNHMFQSSSLFNQDISGWDVSSVTDMKYMFHSATNFNQDISGWDVSNVTDMSNMFLYASAFNQDISSWNVIKVTSYDDFATNSGLDSKDSEDNPQPQ